MLLIELLQKDMKDQIEMSLLLPQEMQGRLSNRVACVQSVPFKQGVSTLEVYDNTLYVGTVESRVLVYHIQLDQQTQTPVDITYTTKIYPHCTVTYFITAVEKFLVIVPHDEQQLVRIWNRQTLSLMHGYKGHQKQISQVIFLSNGQQLASASHDCTVRIWNIHEHSEFEKEMVKYQGSYPILSLEQVDEHLLAIGGDGCCITLWNWKKKDVNCRVFGHPGSVLSLSFYHPFLVSSGGDSKIKIWQINEAAHLSIQQQLGQKEQTYELMLLKQIKGGQLSQKQFFLRLDNYQMLIVDATGNIFLISSKLKIKQFKIEIEYSRKIKSIRLWRNYLLYITSFEKKEKKYMHVFAFKQEDFNQYADSFQLTNSIQMHLLQVFLENQKRQTAAAKK